MAIILIQKEINFLLVALIGSFLKVSNLFLTILKPTSVLTCVF